MEAIGHYQLRPAVFQGNNHRLFCIQLVDLVSIDDNTHFEKVQQQLAFPGNDKAVCGRYLDLTEI